ncbi:MAG TPA: hypothetical protein VE991_03910 [Acidimicrobiales bacterium]|nr:hypothetical protein [Acidimicrobiales bacterium]
MPTQATPTGGDDAPPKLRLSHRILAALPSLERKPPAARSAAGGSQRPVKPDAVTRPGARTGRATPANPYADMEVAELQVAIKRLDDRERRVAMVMGPVIAVLDLVLMEVALHDNPALHKKGHTDPKTIVILGVASAVIACLVTVAAYFRRRSFTIFALAFAGYGGGLTTLVPSWFVAGWLLVRFNRMQKALNAKTGRTPGARARPERPARGKRTPPPTPPGPPPSKRYTPPKS